MASQALSMGPRHNRSTAKTFRRGRRCRVHSAGSKQHQEETAYKEEQPVALPVDETVIETGGPSELFLTAKSFLSLQSASTRSRIAPPRDALTYDRHADGSSNLRRPGSCHQSCQSLRNDLRRELDSPYSARCSRNQRSATNSLNISRRSGASQLLIEAVARNIAQQLQLLSLANQSTSGSHDTPKTTSPPSGDLEAASRSSSQRKALDRFTQELERFAQHSGVKGKLPFSSASPTRSSVTLRTISALLPFRPEFRAAGLAVTSKDQARRRLSLTKRSMMRHSRWRPTIRKLARSCLSHVDERAGPGAGAQVPLDTVAHLSRCDSVSRTGMPSRQARKPKAKRERLTSKWFICFPHLKTKIRADPDTPELHISRPKPAAQRAIFNMATSGDAAFEKPRTPPPSLRPPPAPLSPPSTDVTPSAPHQNPLVTTDNDGLERNCECHTMARPETTIPMPPFFSGRPMNKRPGMIRASSELSQQRARGQFLPSTSSLNKVFDDYQSHTMKIERADGLPELALKPQSTEKTSLEVIDKNTEEDLQSMNVPKISVETVQIEDSIALVSTPPLGPKTSKNRQVSQRRESQPTSQELPGLIGSELSEENEATHMYQHRYQRQHGHSTRLTPRPVVTLCSQTFSTRPPARPNVPCRVSSVKDLSLTQFEQNDGTIVDRDVLRGLHIATSAACDDQIDAFVESKTGLRIRRFLADLMPLENLGAMQPYDNMMQGTRWRRSKLRKMKQ